MIQAYKMSKMSQKNGPCEEDIAIKWAPKDPKIFFKD